MSTKTVDVGEAQAQFKELLSLAAEGTEVVIMENGAALARIVQAAPSDGPRIAGLHEGAIWTSDDFDAPLSESFLIDTP